MNFIYGFGQNLMNESNIWNLQVNGFDQYLTGIRKLNGDTTVNNKLYKKLYRIDTAQNIQSIQGLIRQESNKFYYYNLNTSYPLNYMTDFLLYDFNLNTADTYQTPCGSILTVDSTASLTTNDGINRKLIYFDNYEHWIEGIGSSLGLIFPGANTCTTDHDFKLLCFSDSANLSINVTDYYFTNCLFTPLSVTKTNPLENYLDIINNKFIRIKNGHFIQSIVIFNQFGIKVFQNNLTSVNNLDNIVNLETGIYLALIKLKDGKSVCEKFLINCY